MNLVATHADVLVDHALVTRRRAVRTVVPTRTLIAVMPAPDALIVARTLAYTGPLPTQTLARRLAPPTAA